MVKKIIILLTLGLILLPNISLAWDDCPYGETECEYPGKCGRYVDTNDDQICDHSQPEPTIEAETTNTQKASTPPKKAQLQISRTYLVLPIAIILTLAYIISHILTKKQKISLPAHRKFWNILLLISFLISALLGIWLVIKINLGLTANLPFNPLFWHVEMGIVMTMISIFHIVWHWGYFKNWFNVNK